MGHFITSKDIPADGEQLKEGAITPFVLGAGGVGLLLTLVSFALLAGAMGEQVQASYSFSWLFAFAVFITIALGGCFWTLLHNLANAGWGTSIRRLKENLGFCMLPMALFTLPFVLPFGVFDPVREVLWEWFTPHYQAAKDGVASGIFGGELGAYFMDKHEVLLSHKAWYLNIPSWYLRYFLFFGLIGFYIWKLRSLSIGQDLDPNPTTKRLFSARAWSATGMFVFAVFATFMFIDFYKALNYAWFSTMWGVYMFAGSALSSMAVLILVTIWLRSSGYLDKVVTEEHLHIMGKLMFAFVIFWAYISFSQFFLIWYANIPEETGFFIMRNTGYWNWVSIFLVFGHFAIPFALLLPSWVKKRNVTLVPLCLWILLAHVVDMYWIVIPERGPSVGRFLANAGVDGFSGPVFQIKYAFWGDLLAFVAIGLTCLALFLRNLGSANLYPNRDPRILESANLSN